MNSFRSLWRKAPVRRGQMFGVLILTALLFFEAFNYSTTDFALHDLLGEMRFWGIRWATILAIAFCGIDFAGIARLFTPEEGQAPAKEVWYLLGAWLLAATMNAMLTWWGVSIAVLNHASAGRAVVGQAVLLKSVPVFVAVLVWLVRVLIIGTISTAGPRLFSQQESVVRGATRRSTRRVQPSTVTAGPAMASARRAAAPRTPARVPAGAAAEPVYEPLYSAAPTRHTSRQA